MDAIRYPMPGDLFGLDDEAKDKRARKAEDQGLEPCTHCGRGVQIGKGWVTVVVDGGSHVVHPDADVDETDGGYMGAWVLGSTCAKGIPAAARKPWTGWDQ